MTSSIIKLDRPYPIVTEYGYHESFRPQIHSYALVSLRYRLSLTKSKTDKNSHKQQNPNK